MQGEMCIRDSYIAGSGLDVMEGVVVVECCFDSYDEFITEYQTYRFDECDNCNGCCELVETELTCIIEGRILHFSPILVLRCKKCGNEFLPEHTKQMIEDVYKRQVVMFIVSGLIWYPFIKVYDKKCLDEENNLQAE